LIECHGFGKKANNLSKAAPSLLTKKKEKKKENYKK